MQGEETGDPFWMRLQTSWLVFRKESIELADILHLSLSLILLFYSVSVFISLSLFFFSFLDTTRLDLEIWNLHRKFFLLRDQKNPYLPDTERGKATAQNNVQTTGGKEWQEAGFLQLSIKVYSSFIDVKTPLREV